MYFIFLLQRSILNSHRLHTPYVQSHSLEHPPVSSLHSLLTDQWECPVNKAAFVRPLCRASWLTGHAVLLNVLIGTITTLTSQFVSSQTQLTPEHHPSNHIQQSQSWFQQLFPSCKHMLEMHLHSQLKKNNQSPPSTLLTRGTGKITHPRTGAFTP